MAHDVFISYSDRDKSVADAVCHTLEARRIRCWIAPRDVSPIKPWPEAIVDAIHASRLMVVVFSSTSNSSVHMTREVEIGVKQGIPIIPLRVEEVEPSGAMEYLLSTRHWLDALTPPLEKHLHRLADTVQTLVAAAAETLPSATPQARVDEVSGPPESAAARAWQSMRRWLNYFRGHPWPVVVGLAAAVAVGGIGAARAGVFKAPALVPAVLASPTVAALPRAAASPSPAPGVVEGPGKVRTPTPAGLATATAAALVSVVQSFPAPGWSAEGITWDGASLWMADNSGTIFEMDTHGKTLGASEAPEVTPKGMAWDGSSLLVFTTNYGFIYRFKVEGPKTRTLSSFKSPARVFGGDITNDMAWDGQSLWYANQYNVYRLGGDGAILGSFAFPKNVMGLAWDGSHLWLAHNDFPGKSTLSVVDTSGNVLGDFATPVFKIHGLAWAGEYLWALGQDTLAGKMAVYQLDVSAVVKSITPKSDASWQVKVAAARRSQSLPRDSDPSNPQWLFYEMGQGSIYFVAEIGLKSEVAGAALLAKDITITDDRQRVFSPAGIQTPPNKYTLGELSGVIRMQKAEPPYITFEFEIRSDLPNITSTTSGEMPYAAPIGGWPTIVLVWVIPVDARKLKLTVPGAAVVAVQEPQAKE